VSLFTLSVALVSFVAMVCGIGALIVVRRSTATRMSRQLAELAESQESLNLQMRSVKVRLSALTRPRKNGKFAGESETSDKEPADPAEWKRRMNLRLALGEVKPR